MGLNAALIEQQQSLQFRLEVYIRLHILQQISKFLRIDAQSDFRGVGCKRKNAKERTNIIHEFEGCFLRGQVP